MNTKQVTYPQTDRWAYLWLLLGIVLSALSFTIYRHALASLDYFTTSDRVIVAQVPTQHVFTIYPVIGDLLG